MGEFPGNKKKGKVEDCRAVGLLICVAGMMDDG